MIWMTLAATIIAASTSSSDVQSAINSSVDGDVVSIPSGSSTWTTTVTAGPKQISIIGSGRDSTVVTWTKSTQNFGDAPIWWEVNGTKGVRISQMGFLAYSNAPWGCIAINGSNNACRVDNCKFTIANLAGSCRGVYFIKSAGVIDHCYFYAPSNTTAQGVTVNGITNYWQQPHIYGSAINTAYIEDCSFDFPFPNDGNFDAYSGANVVLRHCNITNCVAGGHGSDTGVRGYRSFEMYSNVVVSTFLNNPRWFFIRGASGYIYGNTVIGDWTRNIVAYVYRADHQFAESFLLPWGYVTGSNYWDGNFDATGWPTLDQIGRGSFPNGTSWPNTNATSYAVNDYEDSEPMYQWGNIQDGTNAIVYVQPASVTNGPTPNDLIKPNRDYYDNVAFNYTPLVYPHPLQGRQNIITGGTVLRNAVLQ